MLLTIVQYFGLFYIFKLVYFFIRTTSETVVCKIISTIKPIDLPVTFGKWAVVTGSTDGIGKAYAIQLAKRKMNLVLISRNLEKLKDTAAYIQNKYAIEVRVVQADFSEGKKIYDAIQSEIKDLDIGILVNNVGVAPSHPIFRTFENTPDEHIWNEVIVNVGATSMMTKMVLPQMKSKRRGVIVNLGSMSAQRPHPFLTHYGSTKAFTMQFSKSLQAETQPFNIQVQNLAPGLIRTNMTKNNCITPKVIPARIDSIVYPNATLYAEWAITTLGRLKEATGYWVFDIEKYIFQMQTEDLFTLTLTKMLHNSYGTKLLN